jgi:dGTPase
MKMEWKKLLCEQRISGKPNRKNPADLRSEFEKDYDRAIFSTPVRRLQDKAQVFVLETHDAVRTRLTHSIEVSTVAKDLTHAVVKWMLETPSIGIGADEASNIETIAATCGLIHDLGNPPFGHAGENAISSWFKERRNELKLFDFKDHTGLPHKAQLENDFLSFEGNAQTIRLLSKLQLLVNLFGLNITFGTLSAACKYTAASNKFDSESQIHEISKPGFFASENDLIAQVREKTGTDDFRNPITFLVEAADDIVYSTVDIEDAVKKGIIDWYFVEKQLKDSVDSKIYKTLKQMMMGYLKGATFKLDGKNKAEVYSQTFRIFAINLLVPSVVDVFKAKYDKIMAGEYHGELVKDCSAKTLVKACKTIGKKHIYCSKETTRLEVMGREIIHDLMDLFWEGVLYAEDPKKGQEFSHKIYSLMSDNYRIVFENALSKRHLPKQYCQMQLVTDYICGMTDNFARTLHRQLKNG